MVNLFKNLFCKFQLRIYANRIPFLIIREFGLKQLYLPHQIDYIIEKFTLNRRYAFYAYAILASEKDYISYIRPEKTVNDYIFIRQKIADHYFNGDTTFTICDLLAKSRYRMGANPLFQTKFGRGYGPALGAERAAAKSYWDCFYKCKENKSFKLTKE